MSRFCFAFISCPLLALSANTAFAGSVSEKAYGPEESVQHMTVTDGFKVTLFAGEPDVRQPIACCLDDRGRLWVAENYDYRPMDKTKKNENRIVILEDSDGDGRFDKRKIFMDHLGFISAIQVGFGGVWIGMAPNFQFIPDRNGDDVPDGPPETLLDGFGLSAWHFLNNFEWGPDGWLYSCHGISARSYIGKPGTPGVNKKLLMQNGDTLNGRTYLDAGVWRYHPTQHRFEIFARGFSNPWGIDWDDHGQMFLTCCIIPPLWHVIQGGRYVDQSERLYNSFKGIETIYWKPAKGDKPPPGWIARPGGAPGGALLYQGDSFPAEFRGKLLSCSVHSHSLICDRFDRKGSGFIGWHETTLVQAGDANFMAFHVTLAPDGGVYFLDWNSRWGFNCHGGAPGDVDTGRIYKLQAKGAPVVKVDLGTLNEAELVALHLHKNEWHVRHARRILQERAALKPTAPETLAALQKILATHPEVPRRLRALWTLHALGALTPAQLELQLTHVNEYMRAWAVQLLCENGQPTPAALARFIELAKNDPSPVVRLYLTSALQRLAPVGAWPIALALAAHGDDAPDHNLPAMLWFGVEPLIAMDPARGMDLIRTTPIALIQEYAARRIVMADETRKSSDGVTRLLKDLPALPAQLHAPILRGIATALTGRHNLQPPDGWMALKTFFVQYKDGEIQSLMSGLGARFGDAASLDTLLETARDDNEKPAVRAAAIDQLAAAGEPRLAPLLSSTLNVSELRNASLNAASQYRIPSVASALVNNWKSFDALQRKVAGEILASRSEYVKPLLDGLKKGELKAGDFSAGSVLRMAEHKNPELDLWIKQNWGAVRKSSAEKLAEIQSLTALVAAAKPGEASPARGHAVFKKTCLSCHTLFEEGGKVGPDLTQSSRRDLKYLLENIIDPSASVTKEYQSVMIKTKDGRVLTGLIRGETDSSMTLVTATESLTVPRNEIAQQRQSEESLMPEGLLNTLSRQEIQDLLSFLRSEAPPAPDK